MHDASPRIADAELRRRLVLWAAVLAVFTSAVEGTIVATAMPTIVADLGGLRLFTWVFAVYFLTQAVTIPIYGRLSDVIGRKTMFFVGIGIFLISSILCGAARSMEALVAFRALQGIGAGGVQPVATTIVGDLFSPAERPKVQGYLSATWGIAAVMGPVLGAFLVERVSWSAIFWINVPIGLACIVVLGLFLHENVPTRRHHIDYLGSVLLATGIGAVIADLVMAPMLPPAAIVALALTAIVALGLLVVHERRTEEPMLPLQLFGKRIIVLAAGGNFSTGMLVMAIVAFIPNFIHGVLHGTAFLSGSVLAAMSVSWSLGSVVGGRMMLRTTYRNTASIGGALATIGTVLMAMLDPARGAGWAAVGGALIGWGFGFGNSSFLVSAQSSIGWELRGAATGLLLFMRMVGQAVGTSLFGAVFNAVVFARGTAAVSSDAIEAGTHAIFSLSVVLGLALGALALAIPPTERAVRAPGEHPAP